MSRRGSNSRSSPGEKRRSGRDDAVKPSTTRAGYVVILKYPYNQIVLGTVFAKSNVAFREVFAKYHFVFFNGTSRVWLTPQEARLT